MGDVYRKVMGDAPLAYVETVGGQRVSEDDLVSVGKNDVSFISTCRSSYVSSFTDLVFIDLIVQSWSRMIQLDATLCTIFKSMKANSDPVICTKPRHIYQV